MQVTCSGMLFCVHLFQLPQFAGARLGALASLLFAFVPPSLLLTYLLQSLFSDEMRALQVHHMFCVW